MRASLLAGLSLVVALGGAVLASGCESADTDPPVTSKPDAGADAAPPPAIPPLAPESEPEAFPVPQWMRTVTKDPAAADPVREALENGTFTPPAEPGMRADGTWNVIVPDENGGIGKASAGLIYAAATIDVPADRFVLARADAMLSVWTNNAWVHPGDPYASGRTRVPLSNDPGSNIVVLRAAAGPREPQIQLFTTPDEIWLNPNDVTFPDLVVGDASTQYLGVPVLNLRTEAAYDVAARVEDSPEFDASVIAYPSLPAGALTQIAFQLVPKAPPKDAGQMVKVGVKIESTSLKWSYRREITLSTVAAGATHRRTFRSALDGSTQYYECVPPKDFDPAKSYSLVLTLHGASVEGIGQAQAYSAKDWAYIVAPTNRRPFGFDWESFGRLDAIEVLDETMAHFPIAPDRVYLTGHSMGGHGTWNVGVLFPGSFATLGPSAGWSTYYSYAGLPKPTGAFARSQAASDTMAYVDNLARRGAYVIHGSADDNVPVSEANKMLAALAGVTSDVQYHEQPGAGHWWDGEASPGADCVDWPPLFDFMKAHTLDPFELDFRFTTPSPAVNPRHSFVTIHAQETAYQDSVITSERFGEALALQVTNVRSMEIAGAALRARGVTTINVNGSAYVVPDGPLTFGPHEGKRLGLHGPIDEVFQRPFCLIHADEGSPVFARYAAFLLSNWQIIGNGQGCALPLSRVTADIRSRFNLIYVGVPAASIAGLGDLPVSFGDAITVAGKTHDPAGLAFVFPASGRIAAAFVTTPGDEWLVYRFQPFQSAFVPPDYMIWSKAGLLDSGFFTPDWKAVETP